MEFARIVPASGKMTVCEQQFWLGPDRAGATITFWADTTVVHLLVNGIRLKTVPSRLTVAHLERLVADGACPAGAPPIVTGDPADSSGPIEVDRLVNSLGQVGLAGRQRPIGSRPIARFKVRKPEPPRQPKEHASREQSSGRTYHIPQQVD